MLRSFSNDYADHTTISKNLSDKILAAEISSDLILTSHWRGGNWLVLFNASKAKTVTFNHQRSELELPPLNMNGCPLEEATYI